MAAGHPQNDVLSRVRREQRMRGKPSGLSGLRIVLGAAAITLTLLLLAFGAIGLLMRGRTPQEPIASRFDPAPPVMQQAETPTPPPATQPETPSSVHVKKPEPVQEKADPDTKPVKAVRILAPPSQQKDDPSSEPETTASIPESQENRQEPRPVQLKKHHAVRRPPPEAQNDNPLFQLFGIKKYR
jgi:hypothetical protein